MKVVIKCHARVMLKLQQRKGEGHEKSKVDNRRRSSKKN